MKYRILGPLEVERDDGVIDIGGPKPGLLLAVLLLNRNEPVSIDALADALWGDAVPPNAAATLQVYVSRLRRALIEPDTTESPILTRRPGYLIKVAPGELDADVFEMLVNEGAAAMADGAYAIAAAKLGRALSLWRGGALSEYRYERSVQADIDRLEEMRLVALEDRLEADLAMGRHEEVVTELIAATSVHPFRERMQTQLMLALYRSGRRIEALEVFRVAATTLSRDFGVDPGPLLSDLQRRILNDDPSLGFDTSDRRDAPATEIGVLPLLGRSEQLLALDDASRLAERGRKVVVDLEGSAGSGKSRLLEEFLATLDPERFGVRQSVAFKATGSAPGALLQNLSMPFAAEWAESSHRTPVVVVDDAQWADAPSLRKLRELMVSETEGVLLVFAHRPVTGLDGVVLRTMWDAARAEGVLVQLSVSTLGEAELAAALDAEDPVSLAREMLDQTGGLPLRLVELVSHWIATGGIARNRNRLTVIGTLHEWAGPPYAPQKLAVLADEERLLLDAICLAGAPLTVEAMMDLSAQPRATVLDICDRLERARLVTQVGNQVVPVHDITAVAVVEGIGRLRRADMYGRLARTYLGSGSSDTDRAQAGWYLLDAGIYDESAPLLAEAADRSMDVDAWTDALPLIDGALLAYSRVPSSERAIARLRAARAKAELQNGQLRQAAMDMAAAAPHLSAEDRVGSTLVRAWIVDESFKPSQAEVTLAFGAADAVRLDLLDTAGVIYSWHGMVLARLGFVQEAEAACIRGERLLADRGVEEQLFNSSLAHAQLAFVRGDATRAESWYRATLDQIQVFGDEWIAQIAPWWILTLHWCGRTNEALEEEKLVRRLTRNTHSVVADVLLDEFLSLGLSLLGRFGDALEAAERMPETVTWMSPYLEPRRLYARAVALVGLGRVDEAFDEIRNALDLIPEGQDGWYMRSSFTVTELGIRNRAEAQWPSEEARCLSEELLATRRLFAAAELLCLRAEAEERSDLATFGAQVGLDIGVPMLAARAVTAASMWDQPIGDLVAGRIVEMEARIPPEWRDEWRSHPHVRSVFQRDSSVRAL